MYKFTPIEAKSNPAIVSIPWKHGECNWKMRKFDEVGCLESSSFSSCVGLVIYDQETKTGVVAHYSGSLGINGLGTAEEETKKIINACKKAGLKNCKARIFGGASLNDLLDTRGTVKTTLLLRKKIRDVVSSTDCISEVIVEPKGHKEVTLDLRTGKVSFGEAQKDNKLTKSR